MVIMNPAELGFASDVSRDQHKGVGLRRESPASRPGEEGITERQMEGEGKGGIFPRQSLEIAAL